MTSRLDPFCTVLFEELNTQGLSYRTVCKSLLLQGVEISPQALRSWHVRRVKKIAKRQAASPPLQAPTIQSVKPAAAATTSAPGRIGSLQLQIEREEGKLRRASVMTGSPSYLVPSKHSGQTDSDRIQTIADRQLNKGIQ